MRNSRYSNHPVSAIRLFAPGALALSILLTGCALSGGPGNVAGGSSSGSFVINGSVHGGQQPVSGALIQLYTVGTSGLKAASTPLISSAVTSDANGVFNITGTYNCTGATEVYLTATGGNPGNGVNSAISLGTALGACTNLPAVPFVQINELTTVAAAYALAPFAADFKHMGATGSFPAGLTGAFSNAAMLASFASGTAPGVGLASGVTVPVAELDTLANIISSCINTNGPTSTNCNTLFGATGATETFGAALAIASNPGAPAVTALYSLSTANAPFQPSMTNATAPNDFTVAVTTTAGGALSSPYGLAVDASGNAWVTNSSGSSINEIGASGTNLATLTATGLSGAQGIALDRSGNVWVANTAGNSVIEFPVVAGVAGNGVPYTAGGITAPTAIALDSAGKAYVSNFNGASVTGLTSTGAAIANSPFTGNSNIVRPTSLALDTAGNVLVTTAAGSVVKLSNAGVFTATLNDTALQAPLGVAVDPSAGGVFATGFTTGSAVSGALTQFSAAGAASSANPANSGLTVPNALTVAGTSIWIANNTSSGSLAEYAIGGTTPISPVAGFGSLNAPAGVAVDATGSVWTTNSGSNTVSKFIGLASPVATPIAVNVGP